MLRELEIPINPQQVFLGKKEAFSKSTCSVLCVSRHKAVPIVSELRAALLGTGFCNFLPCLIFLMCL